MFVSPLTPKLYLQFTVLQWREQCLCENTGQEIGPGSTCSLPREIDTERDHSEVSVCRILRHFSKLKAVTLHPSRAIVHFVKPDLSVGPQVGPKPDVMRAFYTGAITKVLEVQCEIKSLRKLSK